MKNCLLCKGKIEVVPQEKHLGMKIETEGIQYRCQTCKETFVDEQTSISIDQQLQRINYDRWLELGKKWSKTRLTDKEHKEWSTLSIQLGKDCHNCDDLKEAQTKVETSEEECEVDNAKAFILTHTHPNGCCKKCNGVGLDLNELEKQLLNGENKRKEL